VEICILSIPHLSQFADLERKKFQAGRSGGERRDNGKRRQCNNHVRNQLEGYIFLLIVRRKTERAHADVEVECSHADRKLHESEMNSSSLKSQLKTKREELKGITIPRSACSYLI
jgi:hypothetical protein